MIRTFRFVVRKGPFSLVRAIGTSPNQTPFANTGLSDESFKKSQNRNQGQNEQNVKDSTINKSFDQLNQQQASQKTERKNGSVVLPEEDLSPKFIDESVVDPRSHLKEEPPKSVDTTKIPEPEFLKPGEGMSSTLSKNPDEVIDPRNEEDDHPPINIMDESLLKNNQSQKGSLSETTPLTDNQTSTYFHQESAASLKGETFRPDSPKQTSYNQSSFNQSQNRDFNQTNTNESQNQQSKKGLTNKQSASKQSNIKADSGSRGNTRGEKTEEVVRTDKNLSDMDDETRSKYM